MIPGDPCKAMLGEKATQETCDRFMHDKGFDQPIPVQFGVYMRDVITGDLATRSRFNRSVGEILVERLPVTMELGAIALLLAVIIGIPAGVLSAMKRNSAIDVGTMVGANIGVSMPVFGLDFAGLYVRAASKGTLLAATHRTSHAGLVATPLYEVLTSLSPLTRPSIACFSLSRTSTFSIRSSRPTARC